MHTRNMKCLKQLTENHKNRDYLERRECIYEQSWAGPGYNPTAGFHDKSGFTDNQKSCSPV
jgi:hypothetical protein